MNNRSVLLDGSLLDAVLAPDSPRHAGACALYSDLIDNYVAGRDLLFALSTVLDRMPKTTRHGALAPITTLHVSGQHRAAAREVSGLEYPEDALTVVMLRRERIKTIATASDTWDGWDVEVLKAALSSRTEPPPDPAPPAE